MTEGHIPYKSCLLHKNYVATHRISRWREATPQLSCRYPTCVHTDASCIMFWMRSGGNFCCWLKVRAFRSDHVTRRTNESKFFLCSLVNAWRDCAHQSTKIHFDTAGAKLPMCTSLQTSILRLDPHGYIHKWAIDDWLIQSVDHTEHNRFDPAGYVFCTIPPSNNDHV